MERTGWSLTPKRYLRATTPSAALRLASPKFFPCPSSSSLSLPINMTSRIQSAFRVKRIFHFLHHIVFGFIQAESWKPPTHFDGRLLDYRTIFLPNTADFIRRGNLDQYNPIQRMRNPSPRPIFLYYFTYCCWKSDGPHDNRAETAVHAPKPLPSRRLIGAFGHFPSRDRRQILQLPIDGTKIFTKP